MTPTPAAGLLLALLALAACAPASPPQAAAVATPVLVDNPFFCPGHASSPAPPAHRGEP